MRAYSRIKKEADILLPLYDPAVADSFFLNLEIRDDRWAEWWGCT